MTESIDKMLEIKGHLLRADSKRESKYRVALIGHAVNLLNNHLMRFGNHAGDVGSDFDRGIQLSMQEHTPPEVVEPLTEALTNAARFLAGVFAEAAEGPP